MYWDSLKGFFLFYAQKLSGRAKTFFRKNCYPGFWASALNQPLNGSKSQRPPEMGPKLTLMCPLIRGTYYRSFDSCRSLRKAPKPNIGLFRGHVFIFSDPLANPAKFLWSKMACTGVPHIVLHF